MCHGLLGHALFQHRKISATVTLGEIENSRGIACDVYPVGCLEFVPDWFGSVKPFGNGIARKDLSIRALVPEKLWDRFGGNLQSRLQLTHDSRDLGDV